MGQRKSSSYYYWKLKVILYLSELYFLFLFCSSLKFVTQRGFYKSNLIRGWPQQCWKKIQAHFQVYIFKCTFSSVHFQVYIFKCTFSSVHCQVYIVKCIFSSVYFQVYIFKCVLSVHFQVYIYVVTTITYLINYHSNFQETACILYSRPFIIP